MVAHSSKDERDNVKKAIRLHLAMAPHRVGGLLAKRAANNQFKRTVYADLKRHLDAFLESESGSKWIIMPGLRGVGKTTMLAQLYSEDALKDKIKFYLSLDNAKRVGATTLEVEMAMEDLLKHKLETYSAPIFIFFDEVHFLPDWSLFIKTLIDNANRVFVVCTGSAALTLQTNTDVARRADFVRVNPLSFTEFVSISQVFNKTKRYEPFDFDLSRKIEEALFESSDVEDVDQKLQKLMPKIEAYWRSKDFRELINIYIHLGTLPFILELKRDDRKISAYSVRDRIMQIIDSVSHKDIALLGRFDSHTLSLFPKLLFLLAYADSKSLQSLATELGVSLNTIRAMLSALVESEVLIEVRPLYGYGAGHVRKAHKYRFNLFGYEKCHSSK